MGEQAQQQINLKTLIPVGTDGQLTLLLSSSDRAEQDYQDLSLEMISRLGYHWDNISSDWNLAQQLATAYQTGGAFPAPFNSVDDAYYDASGLRKDRLGALSLMLPVNDSLSLNAALYRHKNEGQGTWFTPYVPTPLEAGGAPISVRTTEYGIDRHGITGSVNLTAGRHELTAGAWFEKNDFHQARRFYGLSAGVTPGRSAQHFQTGPFFTQWEYQFKTTTAHLYVQDAWSITDSLKATLGFKNVQVKNRAVPVTASGGAVDVTSTIEAQKSFLPQAGLNWTVSDTQEVFFSVAQNMRAFVAAATGAAPFAATQAGFDAIRDSLQPETSTTSEIGWRFRSEGYEGVVSAYHVKFQDRLLAVSTGPGIIGAPVALQNVGGVTTNGLEAGMAWKPLQHFSVYGSVSFNRSEYANDVVDGDGVRTALKGKQVVDAPEFLAKLEASYDTGTFFVRGNVNHTGKRYYSHLNDASVPATTLVDAAIGYRLGGFGVAKEMTLQLNATNLLDEQYVSTIGSNGFPNSDTAGSNQTLLAAAPRQVFMTLEARF